MPKQILKLVGIALLALHAAETWPYNDKTNGSNGATHKTCADPAEWAQVDTTARVSKMRNRDRERRNLDLNIVEELERRVRNDQEARTRLRQRGFKQVDANLVLKTDTANANWLYRLVKAHGFPKAATIGEYGLHLVWLLVQHADREPEFQEYALTKFREQFKEGEFDANDLARLTDRLLRKSGRPQAFGTQNDWSSSPIPPESLGNLIEIERNRAQLGLMPLAEYGCMMHAIRNIQNEVTD